MRSRSSSSNSRSDRSDRFDYEGPRNSYRNRDSYDYESEADYARRDYYYDGRPRFDEDYYRPEDRQHRNQQLSDDMYYENERTRNRDEDYSDRNFVGSRNNGQTNYRGGGGDLYHDLDNNDSRRSYSDSDRGFQDRDQMSGLGRDSRRFSYRRR